MRNSKNNNTKASGGIPPGAPRRGGRFSQGWGTVSQGDRGGSPQTRKGNKIQKGMEDKKKKTLTAIENAVKQLMEIREDVIQGHIDGVIIQLTVIIETNDKARQN